MNIDLFEGRAEGAQAWELPPWGHVLGAGVYPLLLWVDDHLIPVGTAFCMGSTALMATAAHVVREALRNHPMHAALLLRDQLPPDIDLGNTSFAVLHGRLSSSSILEVNLWPLEGAQGAQPTDIFFIFPKFQRSFPFLPLPISLAVPRVGSKVFAFGYAETKLAEPELSVQSFRVREGKITNWANYYRHRFQAIEGRVTHIFTQDFIPTYLRGPCFAIDAEVKSGMSGGPVFNEAGHVCGIVSATASLFFPKSASLISLFYPALMANVRTNLPLGPVRVELTRPLIALIKHGIVETDGTEELVTFLQEDGHWRIGPLIHEDDWGFVFDDFIGLQESRTATREPRQGLRVASHRQEKGNDSTAKSPAANPADRSGE